ncbi:hypothetical protein TWF694_001574 [Orbilia ellipsospora]|uniref:Uncharacterized protein n=1 Tax=Orbilia ellipsospora TaxID=2528407 RepID=A0AAV9XS19_9PEZI
MTTTIKRSQIFDPDNLINQPNSPHEQAASAIDPYILRMKLLYLIKSGEITCESDCHPRYMYTFCDEAQVCDKPSELQKIFNTPNEANSSALNPELHNFLHFQNPVLRGGRFESDCLHAC